jgi:multidrug resistance efflux pump
MMRQKWAIVAVGVVVVVGLIALLAIRGRRSPAPKAVSAAVSAPAVQANETTLQGKIRPQHVTGVSASVPGFIEAFLVEPGTEVYEGQVLARVGAQGLESAREVAQAALERAQEQVAKAEASVAAARLELSRAEADSTRARMALDRADRAFQRQQTLFKEGATPRLTYEKVLAEYQAAQKEWDIVDATVRTGRDQVQGANDEVAGARKIVADKSKALEDAQYALSAAEVHSPVDGYVVSRKGEVGGDAQQIGNELFQIATDLYALEVVLDPKPEILKRIVPGLPALVLVLDLQSAGMEGVVREIKDNQVIVEFNSSLPAIKPGMNADVRLKLE